jgi:hypothetical protein
MQVGGRATRRRLDSARAPISGVTRVSLRRREGGRLSDKPQYVINPTPNPALRHKMLGLAPSNPRGFRASLLPAALDIKIPRCCGERRQGFDGDVAEKRRPERPVVAHHTRRRVRDVSASGSAWWTRWAAVRPIGDVMATRDRYEPDCSARTDTSASVWYL